MSKEFAPTFRKLIAFANCLVILIVGAFKGLEHGCYNELLLELSFFVSNTKFLPSMHKTIGKLVKDCVLRASLSPRVTPME